MTKNEREEILCYIAQEIISPLAFDERPAKEVWLELSGKKFNKLCVFVSQFVEEEEGKNEKE
jgi:hypothetical protein